MKRLCVLVGLAGVLCVPSIQAGMQVTMMDDTSQYSYGDGGEFRAVGNADLIAALNNLSGYSSLTMGTVGSADINSWGYNGGLAGGTYFQTFCIETTEYFSPGTTYGAAISYNALYGHLGSGPGVPVTMGAAWLYSQFAAGTLSGYDYTYGGGRSTTAGALQQAIWYLQGESGGVNNGWVTLAAANVADVSAAADGAFGVEALNLGAPGAVQDQLVVIPEPTTCVAGLLLLVPFAASTLQGLRKSRMA